ncbi:unnamed protein product [Schistosoma margrebowiei]|uniref:Uncharacterized protein n=1 Tax=Schistosoma margrebowiei TaxID=48269 RepID=A0A183MQV2_9TREM|nr:unnamed protein product [Schistosoma margrebowiei]
MGDVRTKRGPDIDSDQHMMVVKMKLKLKEYWTTRQTTLQRFNTAFLWHIDELNQFKITLNNRFQTLQDLLKREIAKENNWKGIKEAITPSCYRTMDREKHHHE